MASLSLESRHQLDLFKRQYLQLMTPPRYPDPECLRNAAFQDALFKELFSSEAVQYQPPQRYQLRVVKELLKRIESSIRDFNEEGISDDLAFHLTNLISSPMTSEATLAEQKSYTTYSLSTLSTSFSTPTVTILESRFLLAASGTTGFRTWNASLFLSTYLCSPSLLPHISGKTILELGAGTGFLSILCARYLQAKHVIATDGFPAVLSDLQTNLFLNGLEGSSRISTRELKWGHALAPAEDDAFLEGRKIDLVLGADVTYDRQALPALVSTFSDLVELFPKANILIASSIRNQETWERFKVSCGGAGFVIREVDWELKNEEEQEGPFYETGVETKIFWVAIAKDSMA